MKKRIKIPSKEKKLLDTIGLAIVILIIAGIFIIKPFSPSGFAIHSLGSEEITLELSGSVPATSNAVYSVDGQELRQPVTDLGFQPYDVVDENNQTLSYVDLGSVNVNISNLGLNLNAGDYNLTVTIENSDIILDVPLTVEEDVIPGDAASSEPTVGETPNTESYISSSEDTSQGSIVVGKKAKWRRVINLTSQSSDVNISLPPEAENISVKKVEGDVEVPVESLEISDQSRLAI